MIFRLILVALAASFSVLPAVYGQTTAPATTTGTVSTATSNTEPSGTSTSLASSITISTSSTRGTNSTRPGTTRTSRPTGTSTSTPGGPLPSHPPDVYLHVPQLSVRRIELDVDNLQADINLNANVASLVTLNAGVALSVKKINITISDIEAKLDLVVRLDNLVRIVNRVFQALDLNPMMITAINSINGVKDHVAGEVDGFLGSISQRGTTVAFMVDNLGNIVQKVTGADKDYPVHKIVGDYRTNMTFMGESASLANGLTKRRYAYSPFNSHVDILFNGAGHVVQATVSKPDKGNPGARGK
ncbi:hypothetical protein PRK78_005384 [Emydomyces testavorans]|uniref:Uncharacterized protein n=1 Tax=Emydomyces testavorans TaxID=2070801 RepID=A0AAF0DLM4_9EURO|nr:hypothetical protein PRK78_005384 [Emydomyces testavorans]